MRDPGPGCSLPLPSLALVSGHKPPMFPDRVMFVHFHLPVLPADAQGTGGTC